MKRKSLVLNVLGFLIVPLSITIAQYYANVLALPLFRDRYVSISPTELLFYEGILFLIAGLLCYLGIRGAGTEEAAVIAAVNKTWHPDDDTVGPVRIFRDYVWQAKGSARIALILAITGLLMILVYFLTL